MSLLANGHTTKTVILLLLSFCGILSQAQELPPVQVYSTKQYNAENQNWAVSQTDDAVMFIANNKGLLEFNGEAWKLYPSPNETIIRAVHVVGQRIYTGSYMDFGYWQRDNLGILSYVSLSAQLKIPVVEDEQFWNIIDLDQWVLFQSLDRVVIYNTNDSSFKIVSSSTTLTKLFKVKNTIYFQSIGQGIYKIENGQKKLLLDDSVVSENIVVNMFDFNGELLILTQNKGFYHFDEAEGSLNKWNISSNDTLSKVSVYSGIRLSNGNLVLGTIANGLICLRPNGDLEYQMNQSTGLSNNTVLSLFEDRDENIWLALDNGINCINTNSPFHIYNDEKGTIGTVYTSLAYDGNLYLGTNQGLFYKPINTNSDFTFLKGTQGQVWMLTEIKGTLFCAHNMGTFIVENDKAYKIPETDGTWNIKPIKTHDDLLLQGTYKGLSILERVDNEWRLRNTLDGFDISSRYIELLDDDIIFVSHEYKGVFKINVNKDFTKVIKYSRDASVSKGLNSSLIKYNNDLLYSSKEGVYKYNKASNAFKKDTLYGQLFKGQTYTSGKLVETSYKKRLWSFSREGINYLSTGKLTNQPIIENIPFPISIRNSMGGYENISHLDDQKYLFGSSSGYVIIDVSKLEQKDYQIKINHVGIHDLNNNKVMPIDGNVPGDFGNKQNNISFDYSVFEYEKNIEAEYQYQLVGIYDDYSEWSNNSSELFKNLPFGDYEFNVRARIGDQVIANTASYKFTIARPWYLTKAMIAIYVLSIIVFSLLMHNIYKRYYKKQRERLLLETQRALDLKKLENEQQLMSFENEKLQQDIESKNRELAISTMSLIKKNEFLNTIKGKLKHTDNNSKVAEVVKIIDENLNNTNDWELFQEAFNNADKDFLKKVKSLHPKLTSNDLRLCAYLRLNLSSKEIAPLLNISHRSVEVKRYRLRKKMDLPHESSLTDYILEI